MIRAKYWNLKASTKRSLSMIVVGRKRTEEYENELPF